MATPRKDPKDHKHKGKKKAWDVLDMPSKLEAVRGWALQGSTNEELAEMLGISITTFYEWVRTYPQFADAVKKGKYIANGELLNSNFRTSTGFHVTETVACKVKVPMMRKGQLVLGPDGKVLMEEKLKTIEVEKFIPPNATMGIFMTKNRLSEDYKDKVVNEHEFGKATLANLNQIMAENREKAERAPIKEEVNNNESRESVSRCGGGNGESIMRPGNDGNESSDQ